MEKRILSKRINAALGRDYAKKNKRSLDYTGCSIDFLRNHIEKQFKEGMTWENMGKWHIDHIKPCVSFNLENIEEQNECFNYKNLQPLWAIENIIKSDKYESN